MYLSIVQEGDNYTDISGFDTTQMTYGLIVNVHMLRVLTGKGIVTEVNVIIFYVYYPYILCYHIDMS